MKKNILILSIFSIAVIFFSCKKEATIDKRPKDIDGNVYDTVIIGTQIWMVQNLKTTRYNDGAFIATNLSNAEWEAAITGAYAIYNNNATNDSIYGKLYNWYAVNTGKLAPTGWHVPTDAEWTTLITFLGGETSAGGLMKATGISLWNTPNTGATNVSGFTGLPAGGRGYTGLFGYIGGYGYFWSSTVTGAGFAWYRNLNYNNSNAYRDNFNKQNGFSVRCVRD